MVCVGVFNIGSLKLYDAEAVMYIDAHEDYFLHSFYFDSVLFLHLCILICTA